MSPRTARSANRATDLGLRGLGIALVTVAWAAGDALAVRHRHAPGGAPDLLTYALAAVVFIAGGVGAMLVALGRHVFDEVEVSARWVRHNGPRDRR